MNWSQVEHLLKKDDRAILPLGSTEQHASLRLPVDTVLSESGWRSRRRGASASQRPVLGLRRDSYFLAYPGSPRVDTYIHIVRDILDSLKRSGFRRILICNSKQARPVNGPPTIRSAPPSSTTGGTPDSAETDPITSHASWMENFPWTRLEGVVEPSQMKPMIDLARMRTMSPDAVRNYLGDGNRRLLERSDADMLAIWSVAVAETRSKKAGDERPDLDLEPAQWAGRSAPRAGSGRRGRSLRRPGRRWCRQRTRAADHRARGVSSASEGSAAAGCQWHVRTRGGSVKAHDTADATGACCRTSQATLCCLGTERAKRAGDLGDCRREATIGCLQTSHDCMEPGIQADPPVAAPWSSARSMARRPSACATCLQTFRARRSPHQQRLGFLCIKDDLRRTALRDSRTNEGIADLFAERRYQLFHPPGAIDRRRSPRGGGPPRVVQRLRPESLPPGASPSGRRHGASTTWWRTTVTRQKPIPHLARSCDRKRRSEVDADQGRPWTSGGEHGFAVSITAPAQSD